MLKGTFINTCANSLFEKLHVTALLWPKSSASVNRSFSIIAMAVVILVFFLCCALAEHHIA